VSICKQLQATARATYQRYCIGTGDKKKFASGKQVVGLTEIFGMLEQFIPQ